MRRFLPRLWNEARLLYRSELRPWIDTILSLSAILVFLFIFYQYIPDKMKIDFYKYHAVINFDSDETRAILLELVIIIYLILVIGAFRSLLLNEKRIRGLEEAFRYDKRGTLYNGSEPNIAFRIGTFKAMLKGLAEKLPPPQLQRELGEVGRKTALDFSAKLEEIYNGTPHIGAPLGAPRWTDLSCEAKIDAWTEYDSATGWGIVTAVAPRGTDKVTVSITHLKGLFEGPEGINFAYFLAGYCETVLTKILEAHNGGPAPGRFRSFDRALLTDTVSKSPETVEFSYRWN
jgi:hypothetical protein